MRIPHTISIMYPQGNFASMRKEVGPEREQSNVKSRGAKERGLHSQTKGMQREIASNLDRTRTKDEKTGRYIGFVPSSSLAISIPLN